MLFLSAPPTVIGVYGAPADTKVLFESAAQLAARQLGCPVKVILVAGQNSVRVHARIVIKDSGAKLGKADVETAISLTTDSAVDMAAATRAILGILARLS